MRRRPALALAVALLAPGAAAARDPLQVAVGEALFERVWVAAPASTAATDGLGPLFNARSCAACHPGGGAAPPAPSSDGTARTGLVLRLADDPGYGRQLQTGGVHGQPAEGTVRVRHVDLPPVGLGGGGTAVTLRRPRHAVEGGSLGEPPSGAVSPRLAPSLRGVGLLAAVPAAELAARADPDDRDGDGIRGRLGAGVLGLRAEQAGLEEQVGEALLLDLGLSTGLRARPAGDCTPAQGDCLERVHGDRGSPGVEIGRTILDALVAYVASLPPPQPGRPAPDARGEGLFASAGCASCHVPALPAVDRRGATVTIAPYTDLLLHDLGPGLADEGDPSASLWRTAPLWGIGRAREGGAASFLHDGRARDLPEAILWHGGEAERSKERFRAMTPDDRAALLAFLDSL